MRPKIWGSAIERYIVSQNGCNHDYDVLWKSFVWPIIFAGIVWCQIMASRCLFLRAMSLLRAVWPSHPFPTDGKGWGTRCSIHGHAQEELTASPKLTRQELRTNCQVPTANCQLPIAGSLTQNFPAPACSGRRSRRNLCLTSVRTSPPSPGASAAAARRSAAL